MNELSLVECSALAAHEETIDRGLGTFYEVGSALLAIRDGRLYRVTHSRFADYCHVRWRMSRIHAHRLIDAAKTREMLPIGNKPSCEGQSRPLTRLPPEERAVAWQEAIDSAPLDDDGEPIITAAHVESVVAAHAKPITARQTGRVVSSLHELSGEKFGTIYADPPWQYGNQGTRAATDNHYATMNIEELCAMPVEDLAADSRSSRARFTDTVSAS